MKKLAVLLIPLMLAACTSSVDPTGETPESAIIGNWTKSIFGFPYNVNFRGDGRYEFVTFDNVVISGTWLIDSQKRLMIADNVCSFDGSYDYEFVEGRLLLSVFDDVATPSCSRGEFLSGTWTRNGIGV